jgi:hypothetical protein
MATDWNADDSETADLRRNEFLVVVGWAIFIGFRERPGTQMTRIWSDNLLSLR